MLNLNVPVEEMRLMIRVKHSSIDTELESLKSAFLIDLGLCGIGRIQPMIRWPSRHSGCT